MPTTLVNFETGVGRESYSAKAYYNSQIFKTLFGGSPSDWAAKLRIREGKNWERIQKISKDFGLSLDYVAGINLSDECINYQSSAHMQQYLNNWGCTSVGYNHWETGPIIGQTLDLFTVELCIVKEGDATYITMPPYLCLLGMGKHLAMCTNHLFDKVDFSGVPISHVRRTLLDLPSIEEAKKYLSSIKTTTSVNFLLSEANLEDSGLGNMANIEVTPLGIKETKQAGISIPQLDLANGIAHTNHVLNNPFEKDTQCNRLQTASKALLNDRLSVEQTLCQSGVVQPIDEAAQFGTIITVWMDITKRTLNYKDPGQKTFTILKV